MSRRSSTRASGTAPSSRQALRSVNCDLQPPRRCSKRHLGHLPLDRRSNRTRRRSNRFKTGLRLRPKTGRSSRQASTARSSTLRAAMNWGMAQTPSLYSRKSPVHRFGVRMNKKAETERDRRLSRDEEKQSARRSASAEDEHPGASVRRRTAARSPHRRALELCCRRGRDAAHPEQARSTGRRCQIGIPGATARGQRRTGAFRSIPKERLAADPRSAGATLGPGRATCSAPPAVMPSNRTSRPPGRRLRLLAHGIEPRADAERCGMEIESSSSEIEPPLARPAKPRGRPVGCSPTASTSASSN